MSKCLFYRQNYIIYIYILYIFCISSTDVYQGSMMNGLLCLVTEQSVSVVPEGDYAKTDEDYTYEQVILLNSLSRPISTADTSRSNVLIGRLCQIFFTMILYVKWSLSIISTSLYGFSNVTMSLYYILCWVQCLQ